MKRIGLIAGIGRLPVEFARAAAKLEQCVVAIAVVPTVDPELQQTVDHYHQISVGQLDQLINTLKQEQISQVVVIGKVSKELLFSGVQIDSRMMNVLANLPDKNDDTLMLAFVRELARSGITMLDQTALLKLLMPGPGVYSSRQPSEQELRDMKFGFRMAKAIGGLDIGQTVVVKNQAVMAVEAIEGTDAAIRRGGQLGRGGVVVAKVSKPNQDLRFDVPSVGPDTLQAMMEAGATALIIEAGKTLLVDREKTLKLAEDAHIVIMAMDNIGE